MLPATASASPCGGARTVPTRRRCSAFRRRTSASTSTGSASSASPTARSPRTGSRRTRSPSCSSSASSLRSVRPRVAGAARAVELDRPCFDHLDLRTTQRHHPRRLAGRAPFVLVAFVFLVILAGTTIPAPLYVIYQSKWGFSSGMLTLVFAIYSAGVLVALLVFGRLSDEVGRTRVLLAALAVAVTSTFVFAFATGVGMLLAARLLSGFAAGL